MRAKFINESISRLDLLELDPIKNKAEHKYDLLELEPEEIDDFLNDEIQSWIDSGKKDTARVVRELYAFLQGSKFKNEYNIETLYEKIIEKISQGNLKSIMKQIINEW